MLRIRAVTPLKDFTVRLVLSDGTEREVDLSPYLRGPIFEPLKSDRSLFESVRVDKELGTITWPNGADIDPDVLCVGYTPASWEVRETSGMGLSEGQKVRAVRENRRKP